MMEIAKNVRDFLVGMKETLSPDEESLLSSLQDLHEEYLKIMDDFSKEVSLMALSMSPEARMVAHQLRVRIYQDWRAKLMQRIFENASVGGHQHDGDCECVACELNRRLDMYRKVIADYNQASTRIKTKGGLDSDGSGPESDDDANVFEFPEFLGSSQLLDMING